MCRPIKMMRSAPSRLAASTADSPTAPSSITVTAVCGVTRAMCTAWCPVKNTSDSVSSELSMASSVSSSVVPVLTRVPSAWGIRTASAWAPPTPPVPKKCPLTQEVCIPSRQYTHVLSWMPNGQITKSPGRTVVTSAPTSSTTPRNSCPIGRGSPE
ncbi:MAG: hypothetical protein K0S43_649 [Cellulosimicrobium sp.]|nr:hypothetical protein [Cellulosimicrobium sp.]